MKRKERADKLAEDVLYLQQSIERILLDFKMPELLTRKNKDQ
jgi:hypothetical protein